MTRLGPLITLLTVTAGGCGGSTEDTDPCAPPDESFDSVEAVHRFGCLESVPEGAQLISLETLWSGELDTGGRASFWRGGYMNPATGTWDRVNFRSWDPGKVFPTQDGTDCLSDQVLDRVAKSTVIVPDAVSRVPPDSRVIGLQFQHALGCTNFADHEIRRVQVSLYEVDGSSDYFFMYGANDELVSSCGPCSVPFEACSECP